MIHVSSVAGRAAVPGFAVYCASKFALEALADAYRFELSPFGIDSVLVEPGVHRTPILEKFLLADQNRVAAYGPTAEAIEKVKGIFEGASSAPDTPGPEPVAEAMVRLIETPAGERPFRTVPTAAMQSIVQPYNELAKTVRDAVAHQFNLPEELTVLQEAPSKAA